MKKNLIILLIVLFNCQLALPQTQPNIIFILTDDMGLGDVACYGGKLVPTPNIDALAKTGIRFTRYYSGSPICSPSRVSLLTGMHPAKWNITTFLNTRDHNLKSEQANYLDPKAPSIVKFFKQAGYRTGHFGKWHMGGGRDVTNAPGFENYGFDEHASTYESPDPDPLITATNWIWSAKDSIKRWDRTGYFVDRTLAFLEKNKGKPCFVNLWPDDVHTPWVPDEEIAAIPLGKTETQANLKAVLAEYDVQIGRLMQGLKDMGMDKNTIVIFTSDNGPLPSFGGSRAAGLRGTKLALYEGGIRMPFIVNCPGLIAAGITDTTSVLHANDMLPSLSKIANVQLPAGYKSDGEDRSAVLLGKPSARKKDIYWEYGRNNTTFKYPGGKDKSPNLAVLQGNWKFLINSDGSGPELYNLVKDPAEQHNMASKNPIVAGSLKKKLLNWRGSLPVYQASGNP